MFILKIITQYLKYELVINPIQNKTVTWQPSYPYGRGLVPQRLHTLLKLLD